MCRRHPRKEQHMNKDQIIQMAREASKNASGLYEEDSDLVMLYLDELERFAALVAAAERKRLADKIEQFPFGDTAASFAVWIRNGGEG
jgi:hypothetical protein